MALGWHDFLLATAATGAGGMQLMGVTHAQTAVLTSERVDAGAFICLCRPVLHPAACQVRIREGGVCWGAVGKKGGKTDRMASPMDAATAWHILPSLLVVSAEHLLALLQPLHLCPQAVSQEEQQQQDTCCWRGERSGDAWEPPETAAARQEVEQSLTCAAVHRAPGSPHRVGAQR